MILTILAFTGFWPIRTDVLLTRRERLGRSVALPLDLSAKRARRRNRRARSRDQLRTRTLPTQTTYAVWLPAPVKRTVHDVGDAPLVTGTPAAVDGNIPLNVRLSAATPPPPSAKWPAGQVAVALSVRVDCTATVDAPTLPPVAPGRPGRPGLALDALRALLTGCAGRPGLALDALRALLTGAPVAGLALDALRALLTGSPVPGLALDALRALLTGCAGRPGETLLAL